MGLHTLVDSVASLTVTFDVLPGFKIPGFKIQKTLRSQTGRLFQYKFAQVSKWSLPLEFVPANDVAVLSVWWGANTELFYSGPYSANAKVKLMNKTAPLAKPKAPYNTLFEGVLELEGIQAD